MSEKFNPNKYITTLRGKEYLEVKWRLVWFRDAHPNGTITTHVVSTDPLMLRATVFNGEGRELASGHGSAEKKAGAVWSGRELEKAETAAVGRALAHAGFGTQFTGEDEADNLVDSPIEQRKPSIRGRYSELLKEAEPKPEPTEDHRKLVMAFSASFNAIPADMKGKAQTINSNSTDEQIRKATEYNIKLMEGK